MNKEIQDKAWAVMNGNKGIPDTIYLQVYGDSGEAGGEDEIRSSDVTWSEERIYPTDVEYRRVAPKAIDCAIHNLRMCISVIRVIEAYENLNECIERGKKLFNK